MTKVEIDKAIRDVYERQECELRQDWPGSYWLTHAVWSLVSGADPAVHVVRESDLPEAWSNEDGGWESPNRSMDSDDVPSIAVSLDNALGDVAFYESVTRAIQAEAAVDPVEAQTDALADILYGTELVTALVWGVLERVVRAGMLFPEDGDGR